MGSLFLCGCCPDCCPDVGRETGWKLFAVSASTRRLEPGNGETDSDSGGRRGRPRYAMQDGGKRVRGCRRCRDGVSRSNSACVDGAEGAVVVDVGGVWGGEWLNGTEDWTRSGSRIGLAATVQLSSVRPLLPIHSWPVSPCTLARRVPPSPGRPGHFDGYVPPGSGTAGPSDWVSPSRLWEGSTLHIAQGTR